MTRALKRQWWDECAAGQRVGLYGLLDRYIATVGNATIEKCGTQANKRSPILITPAGVHSHKQA